MTDMEREAREAAKKLWLGLDPFPIMARSAFVDGYLAAAAPRDQEIERLRAKLDEAKSAIRWMHGYDEPGTEDFPFCPEGKRFAWRSVARQQFAIVREACAEPIPLPEPK